MDSHAPVIPTTNVYPSAPSTDAEGVAVQRVLPITSLQAAGSSPFLRLEHSGPTTLGPSDHRRGNQPQPIEGVEHVTLVYRGDVQVEDEAGGRGQLSAGDVHWLTAGTGLTYVQRYGRELTQRGGVLEVIQLLIDLPAEHRGVDPRYRDIRAETFPVVSLAEKGVNYVRLIAGQWEAYTGPARTYSPLTIADVYLDGLVEIEVTVEPAWRTFIYVISGAARVGPDAVGAHEVAMVSDETDLTLHANGPTHLLFLSGLPNPSPTVPIVQEGATVVREDADELAEAARARREAMIHRD